MSGFLKTHHLPTRGNHLCWWQTKLPAKHKRMVWVYVVRRCGCVCMCVYRALALTTEGAEQLLSRQYPEMQWWRVFHLPLYILLRNEKVPIHRYVILCRGESITRDVVSSWARGRVTSRNHIFRSIPQM